MLFRSYPIWRCARNFLLWRVRHNMLTQDAMTTETTSLTAVTKHPQDKQRGALKTKRDEIDPAERLPKPDWIRIKLAPSAGRFCEIKDIVRVNQLVTVCEEASCPNIGECWSKGTATFMIMALCPSGGRASSSRRPSRSGSRVVRRPDGQRAA